MEGSIQFIFMLTAAGSPGQTPKRVGFLRQVNYELVVEQCWAGCCSFGRVLR